MRTSIQRSAAEGLGNGPAVSPLERAVERAAAELITAQTLDSNLLQKPSVSARRVDETQGVGLIVLAEHIDWDGGWCGSQFRYSIWVVRSEGEMHRIYSDHAYHRPDLCGRSPLEGRNPRLELIEVVQGGVAVRGTGCNGAAFGGEKKFIVGFDGGLRDCDSFADQARHHIARIGPKLGYDHLSAFIEIPGEDIAAAIFSSENGRDYGHDTIYLAFRDGAGEMQSRTLLRTSPYAVIQHVKILDGCVAVAVSAGGERRFVVPLSELRRGASVRSLISGNCGGGLDGAVAPQGNAPQGGSQR